MSRICADCRQLISCVSAMRCPAGLRINMQLYFSFMTPALATMWSQAISRNEDSDTDTLRWAEGWANGSAIQNYDAEGG
jgi:hypothetical protein